MWASEVIAFIRFSVSSALSTGRSMCTSLPCRRITGGTPTRICKSEPFSSTTTCNRSSICTDISGYLRSSPRLTTPVVLVLITHGNRYHFLRRGDSRHDFADTILTQCPHPQLARPRANDIRGHLLVNQPAHLVVHIENLINAHAAAISRSEERRVGK